MEEAQANPPPPPLLVRSTYLEPMLSSVGGDKILKIVNDRNALGLDSPEEVVLDRVGVVAEGDLDRTVVSVNVLVVRSALIRLMLLHQRKQFLSRPALGLEIVVVRGGGASVHHEVNGATSAQDMGNRDHGTTTGQPLGRPRLIEGGRLRVQLHVSRVDARPEDPRVVEIALAGFDEEDLEL